MVIVDHRDRNGLKLNHKLDYNGLNQYHQWLIVDHRDHNGLKLNHKFLI